MNEKNVKKTKEDWWNCFCKDCQRYKKLESNGFGKCLDPDATWQKNENLGVWDRNRCVFADIEKHFIKKVGY